MTNKRVFDDEAITDPFGIYRAEWLKDALFKVFTKPAYYPELETPRPCVLVGGRGTGKTTVLRCLSYDGRFELEKHDASTISTWPYYGFYYRVNTNRVTAFRGDELTDRQWQRVFAHYLNLVFCGQVVEFLNWHAGHAPRPASLSPEVCRDTADALYIDAADDQAQLLLNIHKGRRRFEGFLNNLDPDALPPLSLQGQALDDLCQAVLELPEFVGKDLFFIVDEFENLLDYQQAVLNTLIKHCGPHYTFKVGVRDLGWRRRSTLNENEQLVSPADYERIDIEQRLEGEQFVTFATEVCNLRAQASKGFPSGLDFPRILPTLSAEEEAELLGVRDHAQRILQAIDAECPDWLELPPSEWSIDYDSLDQGRDDECQQRSTSRRRSSASCVRWRSCWARAARPPRRAGGSRSVSRPTTGGARSTAA